MELTLEVLARAVIVRFFFLLHAVICTWRVVVAEDEYNRWTLLVIPLLLIPECLLTLKFSKNGEWQTFRPCIFIYLASVVPTIWVLEYDILQIRLSKQIQVDGMDLTACELEDEIEDMTGGLMSNFTIAGITLPELSSETWSDVLQQALLFIIIVGRWMLPRGNTGHQQLSNLLLLQIGMAADILEFLSEGVRTDEVLCRTTVIVGALILWTASLIQLPFHWDTKLIRRLSVAMEARSDKPLLQRCANGEVWDISLAVFLQDFPFLCMRLFFLFWLEIYDQGLMFFIAKNVLVLVLQFYRLWALLCIVTDDHGEVTNKLAKGIRATLRRSRERSRNKNSSRAQDHERSQSEELDNSDKFHNRKRSEDQDHERPESEDLDNRNKFQVVEERKTSVAEPNKNRARRGDRKGSHESRTTPDHRGDRKGSHENRTTPDHRGDRKGSHESSTTPDHRGDRKGSHESRTPPNHRGDRKSSQESRTTPNHRGDRKGFHESRTIPNHRDDRKGSHKSTTRENDPLTDHDTQNNNFAHDNAVFEDSASERTPPSKGVDKFQVEEEKNKHDVDSDARESRNPSKTWMNKRQMFEGLGKPGGDNH